MIGGPEYVSNTRVTKSGFKVTFEKEGPETYRMRVSNNAYRGVRHILVGLSKDDVRALYLMLDDVVGTF